MLAIVDIVYTKQINCYTKKSKTFVLQPARKLQITDCLPYLLVVIAYLRTLIRPVYKGAIDSAFGKNLLCRYAVAYFFQ